MKKEKLLETIDFEIGFSVKRKIEKLLAGNEYNEFLENCIDKAENVNEFIDFVLNDATEDFKKTYDYAYFSKKCDPNNHWYKIRSMLSNASVIIKTLADAGSVKVGDENFSILIDNGFGDGITRVAIFTSDKREQFHHNMMNFKTFVSGKFNIYDYDCGDTVSAELDGEWAIYSYEGLVAFIASNSYAKYTII